jgi:hypothetical protein
LANGSNSKGYLERKREGDDQSDVSVRVSMTDSKVARTSGPVVASA